MEEIQKRTMSKKTKSAMKAKTSKKLIRMKNDQTHLNHMVQLLIKSI